MSREKPTPRSRSKKKAEVSLVRSSAAEYLTFVAAAGNSDASVEMRYEDENVWLVEHKTRGKSLTVAESQAFAYIEDLAREGRFDEIPRFVIVSDFARIALYDLEPDEQADLPLFVGRQAAEYIRDTRICVFHRNRVHGVN